MHQQKILLLENVAAQVAGVRELLSQAGFDVAVSRYENEGLKRLSERGADLVLVSTAHPAGDFVEYCRRVRALVPAARIVVTSSRDRARLFEEHPGLKEVIDEVLPLPYGREEVVAMLPPAASPPASSADLEGAATAELRAEFQRQLDAKFLEVEELKRHLEVATRRVASTPGLEWLQSENEHLRQGVEEERKRSALALASEQLKRSEIEVKLDNLLRMKEDFEFRAQNEIGDRTRELEQVRVELRASSAKTAEQLAKLKGELELALIDKEQVEERLHTLEAGGPRDAAPADAPGIAALQAELSQQRAQAAEGQVALADLAAKAAVLEEALAGERSGREAGEHLLAQARAQRAAADERRAAVEGELAAVRQELARDARLAQERQSDAGARIQALLERAEGAERRCEQLQSACAGLQGRLDASAAAHAAAAAEAAAQLEQRAAAVETAAREAERLGRELAASGDRVRDATAESERSRNLLAEREQAHAAELRSQREESEAEALERHRLQALAAERLEQAGRDVRERDGRIAGLREELATAEAALVAARDGFAAREREVRLQLETQQTATRELEGRLATQAAAHAAEAAGAGQVHAELRRIQELLEEVISRARTEAMDFARRDSELSTRLQAALDERRLLQERFDRASAEASERERRAASLLQSAIDHGGPRAQELPNLPAIVPPDPDPGPARSADPAAGPPPGPGKARRPIVLAAVAAAALAGGLAVFAVRWAPPPAEREREPAFQRPQSAAPAAATTPREIWERWTRSDGSGGVLVQATLLGEQAVRAEIEADRAPGTSDEEVRRELARRLSAFRFSTTCYVSVYLKNLAPGYPAYLNDLPGRFKLRDSAGREAQAFLPQGHEQDPRVYSFGSGAPASLIYEASVTFGFDRASLSPAAGYLQLVVSNVGTASRRVLTWELE